MGEGKHVFRYKNINSKFNSHENKTDFFTNFTKTEVTELNGKDYRSQIFVESWHTFYDIYPIIEAGIVPYEYSNLY